MIKYVDVDRTIEHAAGDEFDEMARHRVTAR